MKDGLPPQMQAMFNKLLDKEEPTSKVILDLTCDEAIQVFELLGDIRKSEAPPIRNIPDIES